MEIENVILRVSHLFKEQNLSAPRRIVISHDDFEKFRFNMYAIFADQKQWVDPDSRYESFKLYGITVSRLHCTCGAL